MTVADLIRELQSMPPHAEVRVAMETVVLLSELGEYEITLDQLNEAQSAKLVRYEGQFVGIYA